MTTNEDKIRELKQHASNIRKRCLDMAFNCGGSAHLGGGLSLIEALTVLYGDVMNTSNRALPYNQMDKFILSKGHGVLGFYAALAEFGIVDKQLLMNTFMQNGSDFIAHPVMKPEYGLESSSGSLGQGISMAVGMALAAKKKDYPYQTYVLCGNGESNEGSVWEACMSAINYGLDNFTLFIDNNHMQSDGHSPEVMNISEKYDGMLQALGFQVFNIDGNDMKQVYEAFKFPRELGKPKAIVGNTIKGKGVSFMENNNEWHHNRLTQDRYNEAIKQLEEAL